MTVEESAGCSDLGERRDANGAAAFGGERLRWGRGRWLPRVQWADAGQAGQARLEGKAEGAETRREVESRRCRNSSMTAGGPGKRVLVLAEAQKLWETDTGEGGGLRAVAQERW